MKKEQEILRLKENKEKDDMPQKKWYQNTDILDWIFLVGMLTINPSLCYIMIAVLTPFNPSLLLTIVIVDVPLFLWFRYDRMTNKKKNDLLYTKEEWEEIKKKLEELKMIEETRATQINTENVEPQSKRRFSFRKNRDVS